MGKIKGSYTLGVTFDVNSQKPIDSRMRVEYLSDLTKESTWQIVEGDSTKSIYDGMVVVVMYEGESGKNPCGDVWVLPKADKWNVFDDGTVSTNGGWKLVCGDKIPAEQHKLLYSYDDKTLTPDFLMKKGIYVVDNEEDFEKCKGYFEENPPIYRMGGIVYNNLILRNDTNEVYELSGSTFDVLSGSIPTDYFTGSHILYNDITEKLWYSDGIEIIQIATNSDGGGLFCHGSGITFNDNNEDCVTINSNTEGTTVEDIRCTEGAPVDGRGLWNGGDIIPSGTTLQEILVKLLCRELFPNAATKPNIKLELGGNGSLSIQEIGASVTIPSVTISKIDGKFNSGNYSKTQPSPRDVTFSGYTITSELNNGFSGYTEIDETNVSSGFTVYATTATVLLGSNKITFDGKLYYTKPSNMPLTNLDNETQSTKEISTDGSDVSAIWSDSAATKSLTVTAEGVYPVFINTDSGMTSHIKSNVVDGIETAVFAKLPLTSSNEIVFNEPGEEDIHLIIDFPRYYNDNGIIKERILNIYIYSALLGKYVSYTGSYNNNYTLKHSINGEYYDYKRLEFTGGFVGPDKYKLGFNASLNK